MNANPMGRFPTYLGDVPDFDPDTTCSYSPVLPMRGRLIGMPPSVGGHLRNTRATARPRGIRELIRRGLGTYRDTGRYAGSF